MPLKVTLYFIKIETFFHSLDDVQFVLHRAIGITRIGIGGYFLLLFVFAQHVLICNPKCGIFPIFYVATTIEVVN